MRNAPDMPELQKDHAAFGVNGIDHLAPAGDLLLGIDAGTPGLPKPVSMTGEASAISNPPGVARWA
jgi:hypothetical protein